jgi:hypothetical protein
MIGFLQPLSERRIADPTAAPRRFCQKPAHLAGKEVAMRKIKPIHRKKVSEVIVEEINRLIEQGELPLDSKLPSEKELSDMF